MVNYVEKIQIAIDASDKCKTRKDLFSWMESLANFGHARLHLLITSRRGEDIKSELKCKLDQENIIPIQQDLVSHGIRAYAHERLHNDYAFERWRSEPSVQDEVEIELMKKLMECSGGLHANLIFCKNVWIFKCFGNHLAIYPRHYRRLMLKYWPTLTKLIGHMRYEFCSFLLIPNGP